MRYRKWLPNALIVAGFAASLIVVMPGYSHAQNVKDTYAKLCESCHGASGKGDGPVGKLINPKPTDFAASLKGKSDAWIAKAIKGGGPAVGESDVMPSYGDLSNQQIKEMVDYIKKFNA